MTKRLVLSLVIVAIVATLLPARTDSHSGTYYVSKSTGTYLRSCPSTACAKKILLPKWSEIRLDRHRGTWAYAYYDDFTGWVSLNVIRPVQSVVAPPVSTGAPTNCAWDTWGSTVCAEPWVANEIYAAANYYGVSFYTLMSLAACESGFDYYNVSWAGAVGLFQWLPSTWAWIGQGDIWNVADQANSTAWAFANGYQSHWDCYWRI